jgi:hypothetical protein
MKIKFLAFAFLVISDAALAQNQTGDSLTLQQILQKADSVAVLQDSLLAQAKYSVKEFVVFNELKDKGEIKNSDTIISDVTIQNGKEVSRQVVYSTRKSKSGESKEQSIESYFSFNDPKYNYSLTGTNDSTYMIAVSPKEAVKKGDFTGTVEIDRHDFYSRVFDIRIPKPGGALKEFATRVKFEPLEGGLAVIREMKTEGMAKALFGIISMRFSGEIKYSDYRLLK